MEHACRHRNVVRLSRVLLIAAVVVVLGLVPATVVRASTNLLSNPGFESPLGGTQTEGTANPSFGNWTAYNFRPSIPMPVEVGAPNPVHSGQASGEVRDPPGIGSAFFYQDLSSFDPNSTYTISAWVYPESGEQGFDLEFGWDRGSQGNTTGSSSFGISPTATGSSAWGQSVSAPPVTYNTWHHIQLVVNGTTFTSELYIDGVYEGISSAGQPVPSGSNTTLLIGYGSVPPSETRFFWDDLEITPGIAIGPPSGIVGEWQGNGNANDSVGTNNGTFVDGGYAAGQNGEAFSLDGKTSYVSIPSSAMASVTGAISVSAWVNHTAQPTENAEVLGQYDTHDNATAFDFSIDANGHLEWFVVGPGCDSLRGDVRTVETMSPIPTGQWTQIAGTYNPATEQLNVLVNGQQVPTQMINSAKVPTLCRTGTPLRIGAAEAIGGELGAFFQGEIQDVQLYNTDISGSPSGSVGGGEPPPPSPSCVSGPGNPPRAVVILITGVNSQLPPNPPYDPLAQQYCGLLDTSDPALADLHEMAQEAFDSPSDGPITPIDLTDGLAQAGAVLLPFSYDGAALTGTGTHPTYFAVPFLKNVPGERSPSSEADTYLLGLIHQVHGFWPGAPIFVIGHSEGGLVAEQLFERHSLSELSHAGVARIFSLDSPINGVGFTPPFFSGVSASLANLYQARWESRGALQLDLIRKEKASKLLYLPIGTEGDELYNWADFSCPGIESQVIWVSRPCTNSTLTGFTVFSRITPEPATFGTPSWPSQSGLLPFDSHRFVMQSADNIAALVQAVESGGGQATATTSSVRIIADGVLTASLASIATTDEQVAYVPRIRARLGQEAVTEGGTITITGSGFGTSPGTARILASSSVMALPVIRWTPTQITVGVPAHEVSGLVSVTPSTGGTAVAGLIGIETGGRNRVAHLTYVRTRRAFDGEPQVIEVRTSDARGHRVHAAAVQIIEGLTDRQMATNSRGIASVALRGFGCEPILAISGNKTLSFRACWRKPRREKMMLSVLRKRGMVSIRASIKAGTAVPGEPVHFILAAGKCARLTRSHTRTNSHGTTSVQLVNHCSIPVLVEVTTNHDTLVQGVLVAP
jgi:hypothetical protein